VSNVSKTKTKQVNQLDVLRSSSFLQKKKAQKRKIIKTYMDAPVMSTYYLPLRADFQHKYRFNLILPLVCYVEGSLKMA
jgi:hypothetical protein